MLFLENVSVRNNFFYDMERVRSICLQRTAPVARMYTYPVEYVCVSKSYPHTLPPTPQINPELRVIRPGNGLRWTRRRGAAPRTSSSTSQRIDPRRTGPPGHRIGFRAPSPYIGHVGDVMLSLVLTGCWLKGWEAGCLDCLSRKRKLRESKLLGSRILWTIAWCSWVTNMCVQRHMSVTLHYCRGTTSAAKAGTLLEDYIADWRDEKLVSWIVYREKKWGRASC